MEDGGGGGGWGGVAHIQLTCPQRLHLNNSPAAQGLCITPSAGLNHVTVLHHYCTLYRIEPYHFTTTLENRGALEKSALSTLCALLSLLLPLVIHTKALRDGPLISLQLGS